MNQKITKHLSIYGRVQGVYYRAWCVGTAQSFNLTGWVRNRVDGSVEALATGHKADIEKFVAACHNGPETANVEAVKTKDGIDKNLKIFEQRPTA